MENNGMPTAEEIVVEKFAPHLNPAEIVNPSEIGKIPLPEFMTAYPGERVRAGDRENIGTIVEDLGDRCMVRFESKEGNVATKEIHKRDLMTLDGRFLQCSKSLQTFAGIDASELASYVNQDTDWLVEAVFAADQPTIVGAPSKATKTTQLIDLSVALATQTRWLDSFEVPKRRKVLFITGESNYRAASKRIQRALTVRGLGWGEVSDWLRVEAIEFPTLPSVAHQFAIKQDVEKYGIEVVIIDPLYRGLQGLDTHRMAEVGDAIIRFVKACQPASVIISHHTIKTAARVMGPPTLEDLSGAGLAESAGNWWLLGRNKPYQFDRVHDLSVVYGGRDEQAGLKRIVFNEEDWTFEITSGQDMKEQWKRESEERKQQAKQTQINEARSAIKHALANVKEGKPKSWIEERSGHPNKTTRLAVADLLIEGTLVNQSYQDIRNRTQPNGLILATMATQTTAETVAQVTPPTSDD